MKRDKMTRPIHWHEICRAALVLGVIESYSKSEIMRLVAMCRTRIKTGHTRRKSGVYIAKV
jgi:hypothetical protein